ncbi:hypothetical protein CPB97_005669 [Podila verticillata]|nr:hypothetical protein CPB97_005669 [Podila verticillata]
MATSSLITDNTNNHNYNHINIANNKNSMSHTLSSPSSPPTLPTVVSIAGMLSPLSSPPPPSAKAVMAPTKEMDSMWPSSVNAFGLDQPSPEQLIQQQMQAQSRHIILQSMAVQGMSMASVGTLDFSA